MTRRQKPHETGAAATFLTRAQAIKRLQINLRDFRRLCIMKGIHPHAPRHPKKAGKGSTSPHTFYLLKDIQFMSNEPIIQKFRALRVYKRHLKRVVAKKQKFDATRLKHKKPTYNLNHIVKERYRTFGDALRDLDDCLCMLFLFASFPKSVVPETLIRASRRSTIEFMNYVIASKSLRKVFISIKGYYYQADIQGERVTWLVPHKFPFERPSDVDFRIMSTFVEFYTVMLGFVNYKLYHSLNLIYPPKLINQSNEEAEYDEEQLAAMTISLRSSVVADPVDDDAQPETAKESGTLQLLPQMLLGSDDKEEAERLQKELESADEQSRLFVGKKFFLGREVPRESIVFVIRCFGGQVSWDSTDGKAGATFDESDTSITHQIVDRPTCDKKYALSRAYIQPQWVFDCVNARQLLPVDQYLPGATLPPHLSPFSLPSHSLPAEVDEGVVRDENVQNDTSAAGVEEVPPTLKKKRKRGGKKPESPEKQTSDEAALKVKESQVDAGPAGVNPLPADVARKRSEIAERKLREMLIPKKHKKLYHKFTAKREHEARESRKLEERRRAIASGKQFQEGVDTLQKKKK